MFKNYIKTTSIALITALSVESAYCGGMLDFVKKVFTSNQTKKNIKNKKQTTTNDEDTEFNGYTLQDFITYYKTNTPGYSESAVSLDTLFQTKAGLANNVKNAFKNKVLVVFCTANFCKFCKPIKTFLNEVACYLNDDKYQILLINTDSTTMDIGKNIKKHLITLDEMVAHDTNNVKYNNIEYCFSNDISDIQGLPSVFIYDTNGTAVCSFVGAGLHTKPTQANDEVSTQNVVRFKKFLEKIADQHIITQPTQQSITKNNPIAQAYKPKKTTHTHTQKLTHQHQKQDTTKASPNNHLQTNTTEEHKNNHVQGQQTTTSTKATIKHNNTTDSNAIANSESNANTHTHSPENETLPTTANKNAPINEQSNNNTTTTEIVKDTFNNYNNLIS